VSASLVPSTVSRFYIFFSHDRTTLVVSVLTPSTKYEF
jgi:hypothetical protein